MPNPLPQAIGKFGGASRDRTDGLVVANDALSQLSYSPTVWLDELLNYFISDPESAPTGSALAGALRPVLWAHHPQESA
jgi:hypothetical protein